MLVKLIVIALYAAMIITIGIVGLRRTRSFNDFFLGGGKVGPWMTAFSYGTAYFSAVLFIGFAGKIGWNFGYSGLWIALFNALAGVLMVWGIFGWKIKQASVQFRVSTLCEYLEKRYDSPFLKLAGAIVIFVFMIPYSAAVFMGLSYLFTSNFNMEYWHALVFIGLFTASYIVLGGYKSMAMIDMIFGVIMTAGVILLFFSTTNEGGGMAMITNTLRAIQPKLTQAVGPPGFWALFSLIFLTSVAPFAMPQLVQKFYAIRDRKSVRTGMVASTFFALLIGGVAYYVGATTRIFISADDPAFAHVFNGNTPIFDRLMPELLVKVIPESLSVVILLLILSASMSTLAALVLISSSSLTKDFYHGFINREASDGHLTRMMRYSSAFFVILSVLLAWLDFDTIVAILGISWGALGSFFLGPFIWGLLMKRASRAGAISSGIIGLSTCLILYFYGMPSPSAGTLGMIASLAINPVVSFFIPKQEAIA